MIIRSSPKRIFGKRILDYFTALMSYSGPKIVKPKVQLEAKDSSKENNPNQLTLIGHSAGGCTINIL